MRNPFIQCDCSRVERSGGGYTSILNPAAQKLVCKAVCRDGAFEETRAKRCGHNFFLNQYIASDGPRMERVYGERSCGSRWIADSLLGFFVCLVDMEGNPILETVWTEEAIAQELTKLETLWPKSQAA